jgi:hypothetical protein
MDSSKGKPTPEKKDQVRDTTRKDAEVELSAEELEERIAPRKVTPPGPQP